MCSRAIWTPFSISTQDETHARFQRLVPPGDGRLDFHPPWQHQALGIEPGHRRRCRQTDGSAALWDMTNVGEPQSAAGVSPLVPDHRADQPWLAGMGALIGQMTFGSINLSLFNSARSRSVLFWAVA